MSKLYIVTMHRWGRLRNHTYAVGAYRSLGRAYLQGEMEADNRAGKYDYRVCLSGNGPARASEALFLERRNPPGSTFMRRLASMRAINWYKAGDHARFGAM